MAESKPVIVSTISLLVPPFMDKDPAYWFELLELEFSCKGVTDDSIRFSFLTTRLPPNVLILIKDVVQRSAVGERYTMVKQAVISRLAPSERSRMSQLFGASPLGEKKPSALLTEMRNCVGNSLMDERFLRELWMQRLPEYIQGILVMAQALPLDETARMADGILERYSQVPSPISSISSDPSGSPRQPRSDVADAMAEIAALRRDFQRATIAPRQRSRTRSRHRSPTPGARPICRIHRKYGDAARSCHPPCFYRQSKSGNRKADA